MMSCPLRKCQGRRGCLCPSKPPPFIYSKTTDKDPSVQETIPVIPAEFKRDSPLYIGENAPDKGPIARVKNNPKKHIRDPTSAVSLSQPVKAITAKLPQSDAAKFDKKEVDKPPPENETLQSDSKKKKKDVEIEDVRNGQVQINYNHYKKEFTLVNGSVTAEVIDAEYCLTFAFPKCKIHLSVYSPTSFAYEELGLSAAPLEEELPAGVFQRLKKTTVYWVHVEEGKVTLS